MLAIGMPGHMELIIILAIVLIFFGAGKLPQVLSQMGKGVKAFKDGVKGAEDEAETLLEENDSTTATAQKVVDVEEVKRG
jgi:sec-independent protein translocase protein TatA